MALVSSPVCHPVGETDSLANRLAESKDPYCDHMLIRLRGDFHDGPSPAAVTSKQQVIPRVREPFASEWLNSVRITQFLLVSVTVTVGMRMKLARGMRVPMRMDEIRTEKQRLVVQDF